MKDYILELDKPRELRFGFKAMRKIRQAFGDRNFEQLMNLKVDEIPQLVLFGFQGADPNLKLEHIEEMLDATIPKKYTVMEITELVLQALSDQMGVDVKKAPAGETVKKVKTEEPKAEEPKVEEKAETEETPSLKKPKKQL